MVNNSQQIEGIIKPLMFEKDSDNRPENGYTANYIMEKILYTNDVVESGSTNELIQGCTSGDTILLLENNNTGLIISTRGFETRSITEPSTEQVVRGPREGFTENFRTNTSLLRRKIKNPNLKLDSVIKGKKTSTDVCVAYIEGVANPKLVKLVKQRIKNLNIDSVLDNGYIEQYIEDSPFSIFATIGHTEKPDVAASKILEGRVAILVDGSPFALTIPFLFIENFHTSEDYYMRPLFASLIRILRLISFIVSIFLVPAYIAFSTFHQELIPTTLLFTIANAREGTPFPASVEALILVLSFEILREAGLRLPRPVGQAISIVGALIMGDAAVAAGIVGAPVVIAVAISAVGTFVTPEIVDIIALLRIIFILLASVLGGFGITIGLLGMLIHLATLKSFGTNYFDTIIPSGDTKDSFVRMPLWAMQKRPKEIAYNDTTRREVFVPPMPKNAPDKEDK